MTQELVLLIDDDETLLELLSEHIRSANYQVRTASNGQKGLKIASENKPDLVVLDVMMPGMDGWEVCQRLRDTSRSPVIMLTAKGNEIDKLRGFNLGVDDYVTKPFSFAELVARIRAVLARGSRVAKPGAQVVSGTLEVDLTQRRVSISGETVDLSPTEYRLLEALAHHPGRTVPSEQLLDEVWGTEYTGELDHVKHYIWALRKKLEQDPGDPQHILTERGFGYRFE
jgi:two-component system KDP operon response regulator KdpE